MTRRLSAEEKWKRLQRILNEDLANARHFTRKPMFGEKQHWRNVVQWIEAIKIDMRNLSKPQPRKRGAK